MISYTQPLSTSNTVRECLFSTHFRQSAGKEEMEDVDKFYFSVRLLLLAGTLCSKAKCLSVSEQA